MSDEFLDRLAESQRVCATAGQHVAAMDICAARAEILRLQDAKRAALKLADERAKEANALMMALKSASIQCGNVIYNCEQQPADNQRHLDSWCNVKAFIDTAIRNAVVKQGK